MNSPPSAHSSLLTPLPAPPPPARSRLRWWMVVIGLVVFLLPVVLVTQVVILKRMSRRAPGAESEERAAPTPGEPKPMRSPTDDPGAPPPAPVDDSLPEVLGALTGAHLTQSYYNIGFLADAVESELYDTDRGAELLQRITSILATVDEQLRGIPPSRLDPTGRRQLARARELLAMLELQARELQLYWETDDKEHIDRYQKVRKDAWAGIRSFIDSKK